MELVGVVSSVNVSTTPTVACRINALNAVHAMGREIGLSYDALGCARSCATTHQAIHQVPEDKRRGSAPEPLRSTKTQARNCPAEPGSTPTA